jgi:Xaa-Pro aminopeptidase
VCCLLAVCGLSVPARAIEKQPASVYRARRVALAGKLHGGVAVFFAGEEALVDFAPYRQDSDFYYLTGWDEPGAALLVVAEQDSPPPALDMSSPQEPRKYSEILFLPTRNLRQEKYTGVKLDAATPGAAQKAGVDDVKPMTDLPRVLNDLIAADRRLTSRIYGEPESAHARAFLEFTAAALGSDSTPAIHDVHHPVQELRIVKDAGEIALLKKASAASIAGQRVMMRAARPGITELAIAGKMTAAWMEAGCQRDAYAPIVGSGANSTTLHYSANSGTLQDGDVMTVDAACEYSMYASDITRTVPVNGHFTPRQREIFDIVLGAQKAAVDAFVAGKSKINDRDRKDPDSLDNAAYNYINTHGKDLHGEPLGKYWLHGLGHMVGLDVHDPADYPALLKPGMVFTIEPGVYIPEEKLGVRMECVFLVGEDGKLIDLTADLPHTADEIEAAMK